MRLAGFILTVVVAVVLIVFHVVRLEGLRYERLAMQAAVIAQQTPEISDALAVSVYALKGLEINPFNIRFHDHAGASFTVAGDYKKAIYHLNIVLNYYPNSLNTLINLMFAYYYDGNLPKSFEMRDRMKRIKPSYAKG